MTLDQRARHAAQGIHRAVEVMEMSTNTKEPRTVERFERFRDRKQRNRRVGAIVLAAALTIAAIAIVSVDVLERGSGRVPATPSAPTGTILFADYIGSGTDRLYEIAAAGGAVHDLDVSTDPKAVWSPDGAKILVTSKASPRIIEGPLRPATVDADGKRFVLLGGTADPNLNLGCGAWSPDGRLLACEGFGRTPSDGRGGLYLVRASGGGHIERLTTFQAIPLDFSPDGDRILFTRDDFQARRLYLIGVDGSGIQALTPNGFKAEGASWSPDGRWIVFGHRTPDVRELYLIHPDGTGLRKIAFGRESGITAAFEPTWSPDGAFIAFQGWRSGDDNPDIYLARPDGSDVRRLTDTPFVAEERIDWAPAT